MITETGRWETSIFDSEPSWNINYSSILTQLIHYAGRYCESYASDLFIQWNYNIENKLHDRDWIGGEYVFGFRECGVDNKFAVAHCENPYYYRKIAKLKVTIDGDKIEMELR